MVCIVGKSCVVALHMKLVVNGDCYFLKIISNNLLKCAYASWTHIMSLPAYQKVEGEFKLLENISKFSFWGWLGAHGQEAITYVFLL